MYCLHGVGYAIIGVRVWREVANNGVRVKVTAVIDVISGSGDRQTGC